MHALNCVSLVVFLHRRVVAQLRLHVQYWWFMRIHSWSIMGWKPCWGEPPEHALHAWCLLTDETGSSWRQPCTLIPEPRQGGESAGRVASYSIALCLLENHVWQLKQILSLADRALGSFSLQCQVWLVNCPLPCFCLL